MGKDHYISEEEKRTTIYDIINRFESGKNAKHQSGGGRPAKIFNKQANKKLKRLVNNKDGVSQRKLACRFQCTQSYVNRVIKSMGIQKYRKQEIPRDRSDQQKLVDRAKCATLYRKYRDREWILDDESHFTNSFYYKWKSILFQNSLFNSFYRFELSLKMREILCFKVSPDN